MTGCTDIHILKNVKMEWEKHVRNQLNLISSPVSFRTRESGLSDSSPSLYRPAGIRDIINII